MNIFELMKETYGDLNEIMKTDAPVISTTTGVYNTIYGQTVWTMLNQQANTLGLLPKEVWKRSGWRVITAKAGSAADGGVSEAAAVPDSIKPTFAEVTNSVKTIAHVLEVSEVQQFYATVDDAVGQMEFMRQYFGNKHAQSMDEMLHYDVEAEAFEASGDYSGTDDFESLDRAIASDGEEDQFGGSHDGYYDIFSLDRDSGTTYDSYVDHNSGTDRTLTDTMLVTAITELKEAGANTTAIVTGYDTYREIIGLYDAQVRYKVVGQTKQQFGVNGIQTAEGQEVGMDVAAVHGIPLIQDHNTTQDTLSRIYLLDTSDAEGFGEARLSLSIAKPTQYFEDGISTGSPFAVDKFSDKGLYRTMGEIKCPRLDCQGKIRDLS